MPDSSDRERRPPGAQRWLQHLVVAHLSVLVVGLSWSFGGQAPWARQALLLWGSLGCGLFLVGGLLAPGSRGASRRADILRCLWPLALFDAFTIVSCLNPSMVPVQQDGATYLISREPAYAWLPSSARPALSLRELWQFNGIVLSCFNALLLIPRRRALRLLLAIIAGNALLLAIFGTLQKLAGAKGLWFGLVDSPQPLFFSTFIYHNHWGAFTLLNVAICLALLFHAWRRGGHRDFWHSPVFTGAVGVMLLALSIPLSGSRSSTFLLVFLGTGALVHAFAKVIHDRRRQQRPALVPVVLLFLFCALAVGAASYLGRRVIAERARLTTEQIASASRKARAGQESESYVGTRLRLYRDTWRMAMERPYAGWGLESYATVFRAYDSSPHVFWYGKRHRPQFAEAHSDWLQSIAESGFIGTGLLVLLGVAPLWPVRRRLAGSPIAVYLLAGCGVLLVYAWVEFPFANPSVMVGFWLSLYAAARYADLDQRSDADTRPTPHA